MPLGNSWSGLAPPRISPCAGKRRRYRSNAPAQWQARFEIGNQNVDQILFVLIELAEVSTPRDITNGGDPCVPHFTRFNGYSGICRISFCHLLIPAWLLVGARRCALGFAEPL